MKVICDWHSEDKASRLSSDNNINVIRVSYQFLHGIDGEFQSVRILKDTGNITENNSRLRKIRNASYIFFDLFHICLLL